MQISETIPGDVLAASFPPVDSRGSIDGVLFTVTGHQHEVTRERSLCVRYDTDPETAYSFAPAFLAAAAHRFRWYDADDDADTTPDERSAALTADTADPSPLADDARALPVESSADSATAAPASPWGVPGFQSNAECFLAGLFGPVTAQRLVRDEVERYIGHVLDPRD